MSPAIFSEAKDEKTGPATGVLAQLRACPPTRPTCTPKDSEWSHRIPGLKLVGRNTRRARVNCVQSLRPGKACEAHDGPQPTASTWPSSPKTLEVWVLPVGEKWGSLITPTPRVNPVSEGPWVRPKRAQAGPYRRPVREHCPPSMTAISVHQGSLQ